MDNVRQQLVLKRLVDTWSDKAQSSAEAFVMQFRDVLGSRHGMIGTAQLSALNNYTRSVPDFDHLKKFVEHQAEKAGKSNKPDVQGYWMEIKSKLTELESEARKLANEVNLPLPSQDAKPKQVREALKWLYLWLGQEYIQHLVAHSLFIMPKRNSGDSI